MAVRVRVGKLALLTLAGCVAKEPADESLPCEPGSEPAGELVWSKDADAIALGPIGGFRGLAALPDGGFVAVTSFVDADGAAYDAVVAVFDADGTLQWSEVYDGLAGLSDDALAVSAGSDGTVHVLVRETLTETPWEWEPGVTIVLRDSRLVHLTYSPDGGAPSARWEWERPPAGPQESFSPSGTIGPSHDELVVLGWVDAMHPELRRFDTAGAEQGAAELPLAHDTSIAGGAVDPSGRLLLAGRTSRNGPDSDGWIAVHELDGSLAWEAVIEGESIQIVRAAPGLDGSVLAYWGGEEGFAGAPQVGRFDADGQLVWSAEVGIAGADGYAGRLTTMCDGDFALAMGAGGDVVVMRFDEDGAVEWQAAGTIPGSRDTVQDVVALAGGDLAVAGFYADPDPPYRPWLGRFRAGG